MRIVITFPQRLGGPGGGSIGCQRIAEGLARLGAGVEVVAVRRGEAAFNVRLAVPVREVAPSRAHYLLDAWGVARDLRQRAPGSLDWIVGWSTEAAWLPAVARRLRSGFAMVLAMPSYRAWFGRDTGLRWLKRLTDRYFRVRPPRAAGLVFALSRFTKEEIVELMGVPEERVVVAYWGVDPCFLEVARSEATQERVLFYGSLAPNKGVFDVVAACARLARGGENLELRIAGWGDWEAVRRAVADAGLERRVRYLGTLDREALCRELSRASVALLPSHAESFGLAIAEAQAAGVPVVSYRAGAVPEVVEDGVTGLLVPVGAIDELADALLRLLRDPDLAARMGEAARCRVAERFTWERTAQVMLEAMRRYRRG